ncbi:hypothetical protein [Oryzicola mucosus]|uniref:Uncharacterized protein n=1 Tax=Oryzicola mucosus TaxID=2767425 RepID=A0A8J6U9L1_9HYPH|nr:hypothetical protein [Oryzicola mucosus]MBD0417492.1 hypothetical protein [Oryzicola mucosus]
MSDEPNALPHSTPAGLYEHYCEHDGCARWGSFGFARAKEAPHWFCFEHRDEGEPCRA